MTSSPLPNAARGGPRLYVGALVALATVLGLLPSIDDALGQMRATGVVCTDDAHTFAAGCTHRLAARCMTPILGLLLDGVCGDAVIDVGEVCDDGNTRSGDCCSATCTFEPAGSECGNGCEAKTCSGAGVCAR